jgi:hypothetical protein
MYRIDQKTQPNNKLRNFINLVVFYIYNSYNIEFK